MYVNITEHPPNCPVCHAEIDTGDKYFDLPDPIGALCEDCIMLYEKTAK